MDPLRSRLSSALRRRIRVVLVVGGVVVAYVAVGSAADATGTTSGPSSYRSIPAATVLTKTFASSASDTFHVTGVAAIPTTATAVTLSITVSSESATGHLYAHAAGASTPAEPSVQWTAGKAVSETVTVGIGTSGEVTFKNGSGTAKVVVQADGYYAPATALGTAGGVLTGTYPKPGLAAAAVKTTNLSTSGGAAGEVLTDTGSGVSWKAPAVAFTNTVVVPSSGTATVNGAALVNAVSALPGTATLILLQPGTYDVGNHQIQLPANTWIEGAGQSLTTLTAEDSYAAVLLNGADDGASNLTISDSSTANQNYAMGIDIANSATIDDVTATASLTDTSSYDAGGIQLTDNSSEGVTIEDSTISSEVAGDASGDGIAQLGTAPLILRDDQISSAVTTDEFSQGLESSEDTGPVQIHDSTISATGPSGDNTIYGVNNGSGTMTIIGSQVSGSGYSVVADTNSKDYVADTELTGPTNGSLACVGDYNSAFAALNSTCG